MKLSETRDKDGNIVPSKLRKFVAERKGDVGDQEAFEATLSSMAEKSAEARQTSPQDDCDD